MRPLVQDFSGLFERHRAGVELTARLLWLGPVVVASAVFLVPVWSQRHNPSYQADFHAFYCAAVVAKGGGSPYLALPLATCEQHIQPFSAAGATVSLITAPLSGYFLAFLAPLTALSPLAAAMVWTVILVAAYIILLWALSRLTGVPIVAVTLATIVLGLLVPMVTGQPTPIAVALLCCGALALRRGYAHLGAALIAVSTIEPHFGVPAAIATFVAVPRTRAAIVVSAAILALLSISMLGITENVEYIRNVLPETIHDQARFDDQYSFTYLLTFLHVPVDTAITGGRLSYALLVIVGIVLGTRLGGRMRDPAVPPLMCSACAVVGGPYVHAEHFLAAIPALLLLTTWTRGAQRWGVIAATVLVAAPAKIIAIYVGALPPTSIESYPTGEITATTTSESVWQHEIAAQTGHLIPFLTKLPVWIGLTVMLCTAILLHYSKAVGTARRPVPQTLEDV